MAMTPEQCRELAEFHEHMAEWMLERLKKTPFGGPAAFLFDIMRDSHNESAHYWREKAGE